MPVAPDLWPLDRPLTVDDLGAIQDDGLRYELWDGVLVVMPGPTHWHQELSHQIRAQIGRQLPSGWRARQEHWVEFGTRSRVLGPDTVVFRSEAVGPETDYLQSPDVVMVVEVESPSTRLYDRNTKKDRYSAAGVPIYVRVEVNKLNAPTVVVQELRDGRYVELGRTEPGSGTVTIPHPVPIVIDAAALASASEP